MTIGLAAPHRARRSAGLAALARRRPGVLVLLVLYALITVLVARSLLTFALCSVLLLTALAQVTVALRRPSRP